MYLRIAILTFFISLNLCSFAQIDNQQLSKREINLSIQSSLNTISPYTLLKFEKVGNELPKRAKLFSFISTPINVFPPYSKPATIIYLPEYTQGKFCDFEDYINRNNKIRIDFGVK